VLNLKTVNVYRPDTFFDKVTTSFLLIGILDTWQNSHLKTLYRQIPEIKSKHHIKAVYLK